MKKFLILTLLAAALLSSALIAQASSEDDFYELVCIHNDTDLTISFRYRWGNGSWTTAQVQPGYVRPIWWEYDYANQDRSPNLSIRFDRDLSSDSSIKSYNLETSSAPTINCRDYGRDYHFDYADWDSIDLFDWTS
jgi:opacity protein-like surface antigen